MKSLFGKSWFAFAFAVLSTVPAFATSPFLPPIEDRLEDAVAVVEGYFPAPAEGARNTTGLHAFRITKTWRTKIKLDKTIRFLDDSDAKEFFGLEAYVGRGGFAYDKPLTLILHKSKLSGPWSYYKLANNDLIEERHLAEAKRLWRKKKLRKKDSENLDDNYKASLVVVPGGDDYIKHQFDRFGITEEIEEGTVRFLWQRSFHPAVLFEVSNISDTTARYTARSWDDEGAWTVFSEMEIPIERHVRQLKRFADQHDFFNEPKSIDRLGLDGSGWIIQIKSNGKEHSIYRWSPESGSTAWVIGTDLIGACIRSPAVPIY